MCEYSDHYRPGLWSASWINFLCVYFLRNWGLGIGGRCAVGIIFPLRFFLLKLKKKFISKWSSDLKKILSEICGEFLTSANLLII